MTYKALKTVIAGIGLTIGILTMYDAYRLDTPLARAHEAAFAKTPYYAEYQVCKSEIIEVKKEYDRNVGILNELGRVRYDITAGTAKSFG
ncbi:hypothetical protein HZB02_03295 [Candidatus Woesearchaeota archaeon]|nr:hypothetical protein [Candidatus Woesearchaeota archaeon]